MYTDILCREPTLQLFIFIKKFWNLYNKSNVNKFQQLVEQEIVPFNHRITIYMV